MILVLLKRLKFSISEQLLFPALTKLLVAGGGDRPVEIIDLSNPLSVCQNLADHPHKLNFAGENFFRTLVVPALY